MFVPSGRLFQTIDWILVCAILPLLGAGLITMYSFSGADYFFDRQILWIVIAFALFFSFSLVDWRFLKRSGLLLLLYIGCVGLLAFIFVSGTFVRGAQSWFQLGGLSIQPVDPMKVVLILLLAKYFSRRHVEIAHIKHIIISGLFAFIPFVLVFIQPDFGSAMVIFFIWLGMIAVSGVSKKHLALVVIGGIVSFTLLWFVGFTDTQKDRIVTFLDPVSDIQGAGYNARQSTIAIGSGQFLGKGIGYGTQSRLEYLPEYETDFIFAAFAEEWGFVGVVLLFILFGLIFWRILADAYKGHSNFETLFGLGLAVYFMSHFMIHVGMNIGLLPVTGLPLPFMSYGGSHLVTEFVGLGILMGMRAYARTAPRESVEGEDVIGIDSP